MNSGGSDPVLIGIDWGTSSFRAFAISAEGEVLHRLDADEGILKVPDGNFETAFNRLIGPWSSDINCPILISGMITSKNGWLETPYENLPNGAEGLARSIVQMHRDPGPDIHFVTGLRAERDGIPDVIRGEETELVGVIDSGLREGIVVTPGTHSKWVRLSDGRIADFATFLTGDVFAALRGHTILKTLMAPNDAGLDDEAFVRGVETARNGGPALLHWLFSVRSLPLFGVMSGDSVADYLSGLLIGTEILGAQHILGGAEEVTLVGRSDLTVRYELALDRFGLAARRAASDAVARGHYILAKAGGLI